MPRLQKLRSSRTAISPAVGEAVTRLQLVKAYALISNAQVDAIVATSVNSSIPPARLQLMDIINRRCTRTLALHILTHPLPLPSKALPWSHILGARLRLLCHQRTGNFWQLWGVLDSSFSRGVGSFSLISPILSLPHGLRRLARRVALDIFI